MALSETIGQAWIDIRARMDKLNGDVDKATVSVQGKMEKALDGGPADRLTGKVGNATKALGAMAATGASVKVAGVLNQAANAASDLGEAQNATNVAFGAGAAEIDAFAKGAIESVGLAEVTVRNLAVSFGAMFNAAGIDANEAAGMTTALVKRAVDVGSVFNAAGKEVTEAFGAAIRGEAEPARRFGVFLNAAAIEAEALSSGIVEAAVDTTKLKDSQIKAEDATRKYALALKEHGAGSMEARKAAVDMEQAQAGVTKALEGSKPVLTDADKMQAAYNIILRQTEVAAGDYAKTADSKANADRRAKEASIEASAALGQSLAPMMAKVSALAADVMGAFEKLPGPVQTVVAGLLMLGVVAGPIGSLVALMGPLTAGLFGSAAASGTAGAAAGASSGGFMAMAAAAWAAVAPFLPIILAVGALIAIGVLLWKNWDKVKEVAGAVWGWLKGFIGGVADAIGNKWLYLLGPIGAIIIHWETLKKVAGAVWGWIWDKIEAFAAFHERAMAAIARFGSGIWDGMKEGFKAAWNFIARTLNGAEFSIPAWVPGVGGKTFGLPDLPMLADGGTAVRSGWSVVGERGPELNYMPKGASVVPLRDGGPGGGSLTIVVQGSVLTERRLVEVVRDGLYKKGGGNGSPLGSGARG